MRKLLKSYEDIAIAALAVFSAALLVVLFFWITAIVLTNVNIAITPSSEKSANETFDLHGARQLDLKGQIVPN